METLIICLILDVDEGMAFFPHCLNSEVVINIFDYLKKISGLQWPLLSI